MPADVETGKPLATGRSMKAKTGTADLSAGERPMPTYRYNWRNFEAWCQENGVDVKTGIPAVEKYAGALLERDLPLKTARLYVGGIIRGAAETGITIDKDDPRMEALFLPFVERHRQAHPRSRRGKVMGMDGQGSSAPPAARAGLTPLIASFMNVESVPLWSRLRERAFLLLGFSAGLSVDELVAATIDHVKVSPGNGVLFYLHRPGKKLNPVSVFYWPYGPSALVSPATALLEWLHYRHVDRGVASLVDQGLFADAETGEAMPPALGLAIVSRAFSVLNLEKPAWRNSSFILRSDAIACSGSLPRGFDPQVSASPLTPAQTAFKVNERFWKLDWYNGDEFDGNVS